MDSSQQTYYTARENFYSSPPSLALASSMSSQNSATQPSAAGDLERSTYRPAQVLPYELRQNCGILFEEELYAQALNILHSILHIRTASTAGPAPAYPPLPQHLALAATLLIHPSTSTRASTPERRAISIHALRLLRGVLKQLGPWNADFRSAFRFTSSRGQRRNRRGGDDTNEGEHGAPAPEEIDYVTTKMANEDGVWARADDFWHAVGWSFNCAVRYPRRWRQWSIWLDTILNVLETDWNMRHEAATAKEKDLAVGWEEEVRELYDSAMIARYIQSADSHGGSHRRIIAALFADGSERALREFPELWKRETRPPVDAEQAVREAMKTKAKPVNLDADQYGEYAHDDDDNNDMPSLDLPSAPPEPGSFPPGLAPDRLPSPAPAEGADLSLTHDIRQRIIRLLSATSSLCPSTSIPLETLFDHLAERIRDLPLPSFFLFSTRTQLNAPAEAGVVSLWQSLFDMLLHPSAPARTDSALSPAVLQAKLLPYTAASTAAADNARLSLLCEGVLQWLFSKPPRFGIRWSEELQRVAERGIRAREEKTRSDRRRKRLSPAAEAELAWLNDSGERLRGYLAMMKARDEREGMAVVSLSP